MGLEGGLGTTGHSRWPPSSRRLPAIHYSLIDDIQMVVHVPQNQPSFAFPLVLFPIVFRKIILARVYSPPFLLALYELLFMIEDIGKQLPVLTYSQIGHIGAGSKC